MATKATRFRPKYGVYRFIPNPGSHPPVGTDDCVFVGIVFRSNLSKPHWCFYGTYGSMHSESKSGWGSSFSWSLSPWLKHGKFWLIELLIAK